MQSINLRKYVPLVGGLALLVVAFFVAYFVYNLLVFRITGIDPKPTAVSQFSPYVRVSFNKPLESSSLRVSDFGGVLRKASIEGKSVVLYFNGSLELNKRYSIIIDAVASTDGKKMVSIPVSFTTKDIPIDKLSKDQQRGLLDEQDEYIPYSTDSTTYVGFNELIDRGVSSGQVDSIKTAIFNYSETINKEFKLITLDASSVKIVFHDPAAREALASSATFNITSLGQTYAVRAEYEGLTNDTYTRLFSVDGQQLYSNKD